MRHAEYERHAFEGLNDSSRIAARLSDAADERRMEAWLPTSKDPHREHKDDSSRLMALIEATKTYSLHPSFRLYLPSMPFSLPSRLLCMGLLDGLH